ncbi:MAG: SpoIIE family protein phosphatase [Bacteroidia bacterium]
MNINRFIRCCFLFLLALISSKLISQNKYKPGELEKILTPLTKAIQTKDEKSFFDFYGIKYSEAISKKDTVLLCNLLSKAGLFYYFTENYSNAIKCYDTALVISKKANYIDMLISYHMNRGAVNFSAQKYTGALKDYLACEELMINTKSDKFGSLLGNISLLYREIGDLEKAKAYLKKSLPFIKFSDDVASYVKSINNLALIYYNEKDYKGADSLFQLGYQLAKKNNLNQDLADITYNMCASLSEVGKFKEAIPYQLELLQLIRKMNLGPSWEKLLLQDLAITHFETNKIKASKDFLKQSEKIKLPEEAAERDFIGSLKNIASIYHKLGMLEKAVEAYSECIELIENRSNSQELSDFSQLAYNYERAQDSLKAAKELALTELEAKRQKDISEHKLERQKIYLALSLVVLVGIIAFAINQVKTNRAKEKANKEILTQKKLLDEKNKEITDSITYAKRIQNSLLPPDNYLKESLKNYFVLYLPKDIVSGDFYWVKKTNENEALVAVGDCTGHGVPGAIMSALSVQHLNAISDETNSPSGILTKLNRDLKGTLQQDELGNSKDGLDICLCKIDFSKKSISYSGANRNLWLITNKELHEIKATKTGIAGHTNSDQVFEEIQIQYSPNDVLIMSSDGYADQFGGLKEKKITTKRFKSYLTESSLSNMNELHALLKENYLTWKGDLEQIDDVCVFGIKLT